MVTPYTLSAVSDGPTLNKLIAYLNIEYKSNNEPVGVLLNNTSSSPTVQRIDKNGDTLSITDPNFFHYNEMFQSWKCTIDSSGNILYGSNPRGDGLDLTGAHGDVMARFSNVQYKYEYDSGDLRIWFAPYHSNHRFFKYHPNCYQGNGTLHDHFFMAVYKAGLKDNNGTLELKSVTGVQPWTGGTMYSREFTSGSTPFTFNETLTGALNGATAQVVDYHLTGGAWLNGDAAGVVYLKQPTGTFTTEDVNGSISGANCATFGGTLTSLSLTGDQAITYATNKGAGWSLAGIWSWGLIKYLYMMQYGTRDSQTATGKGIVNLVTGSGYAGKTTGADSIDTYNMDIWGNGTGNGTDGLTSISINNLQDIYGGVWEYVAGLNGYTDGSYHIINRDGTGTLAGTLASGSYESGANLPLADGYITGIQTDELGALACLPASVSISGVAGTSATYFCDQYQYPRNSPAMARSSGGWDAGTIGGIHSLKIYDPVSYSSGATCARLKYIPQSASQ